MQIKYFVFLFAYKAPNTATSFTIHWQQEEKGVLLLGSGKVTNTNSRSANIGF